MNSKRRAKKKEFSQEASHPDKWEKETIQVQPANCQEKMAITIEKLENIIKLK
ncbi:hypothetical protein M153_5610002, partial [Pseudoloma neurophilia]